MRKTTFYIGINIKTVDGFESIGRFYIGNDGQFARSVFKKLKGDDHVDERSVLTIELMETVNNLPLNLQLISCSLGQLGENCALIAKEVFRGRNLNELF